MKTFHTQDRQVKDFTSLLRQTFESVILTQLFPRSEVDILVHVLQSDGGTQ
jgi:exosome complex component RRP41